MRNAKAAASLTRAASKVTMPLESSGWQVFRAELIKLLAENSLGTGWDFDPTSGTFYNTWEEAAAVGQFSGSMTLNVSLDPKRNLQEEIACLIALRAAFRTACLDSLTTVRAWRIVHGPET